jgi:flagellar biosynthesis protein
MKDTRKHRKAVALAYKPGLDRAPRVTAKGRGKVAEKIIEIAQEHGIYVHDDPDLVETLAAMDLREEIPEALYLVVAELLAFLYSLEGKKQGL